jgi:transposase-like protein
MISPSVLLRMRNISDKSLYKNSKHSLYSIIFFPENPVVDEIIYININRYGQKKQMAIRRMRIACWMPKSYKHTLRKCNTY